MVEYLLALALPRRETKDLAKRLSADFGGFGALLSAEGEAIMRLGGVSEIPAAAIKIAQAAALRLLESEVKSDRCSAPGRRSSLSPRRYGPSSG